MIVNIRGTNGSGKSTIAKKFLELRKHTEKFGACGNRRPEAYRIVLGKKPIFLLGPYTNVTGGMDALGGDINDAIRLLNKYVDKGHVLFEGMMISTTFGAIGDWMLSKQASHPVIVAYLSTPLETCLEGVEARATAYTAKTKNVAEKHKVVARTRELMNEAGIRTETISRANGFEKVRGWLK